MRVERGSNKRIYYANLRREKMSTPSITVSEHHNETGALLNNISTLTFGRITKGTHSRVKVIKIAFSNATSVGNLKLGLISDAGITVNEEAEEVYSDGSTDTGHFGIVSSANFDSNISSKLLTRLTCGIEPLAPETATTWPLIIFSDAVARIYISCPTC